MNSGLAFGLTSSLALCFGIALMQDPVQATATSPLVRAGREFLAVLSPELRSKAVVPLATVTAHDWHYVPRDYEGLPFADLDATATGKAKELLRAGLSAKGLKLMRDAGNRTFVEDRSSATIAATSRAGKNYARKHLMKFSPDAIKAATGASGWGAQAKFWAKYEELAGVVNEDTIESEIMQTIGEAARGLAEGKDVPR